MASLFERVADPACQRGLSRLLHFCSREGIDPEDFDVTTMPRFRDALVRTSLRSNPNSNYNSTCRLWNQAAGTVPGWPTIVVDVQCDARKYALRPDAFPQDFLDDAERFLANAGDQNPFAADYAPSVKPSTLADRRKVILQLASALVSSGMPANQVTSLAVLVVPKNAEAALRHLLDRQGGKPTPYLGHQAQLLVTLAKYWTKADDEVIKKLNGFTRGLALPRQGMVDRNRARLRQFDLPANMKELLQLPQTVLADVMKHDDGKRESALRVMFALAVEILTVAPMRAANLVGLDVERHIVETGRGRHRTRHIVIPGTETKTRVPFEKELSRQTCAVLDAYLSKYRHRVGVTNSTLLFPSPHGHQRATSQFSTGLSQFIFRETGIRMHTHLFRHLAGKLRLEHDSSDIETVRQILGHTSSATTLRYYAETRTDQALRRYDETISRLREEAAAPPQNRPKPATRGARA
jgi:integrase